VLNGGFQTVVTQGAERVKELVLSWTDRRGRETSTRSRHQTNLLALNAAMKPLALASTAVASSVVADEVRKLAERSSERRSRSRVDQEGPGRTQTRGRGVCSAVPKR